MTSRVCPRVTLVTQWFSPEPTGMPDGIAQVLSRGGARVEVLTGVPNYPTGVVLHGYSAWRPRTDCVHGLRVTRTPLYPSHDRSAAGRILNYVSWALSAATLGLPTLRRSSVNLVYGSPITAALPALVAQALWRRPFVLIVQDVWPDSVFATGFLNRGLVSRIAATVLTRFTNMVYRRAARIVVISDGMKSLLVERNVPEDKLDVVFNWVDQPTVAPEPTGQDWRASWGLSTGSFVVMYAGNHGPAQDLSRVIEALALVPKDQDCHLVMVGDGVEKERLQKLAADLCPGRVHFVGTQPQTAIAEIMTAANAQLVSLADRPLFAVTVPSKLQAIMAAGQPVLAVAAGDVERIVRESGAGVTASPGSVTSIAEALQGLMATAPPELHRMGERAKSYYRDHMSAEVGMKRYGHVLSIALDGSGDPS